MTIEEAREYWSRRLERASGYSDEHWDADERHAHADYIDALKHAVTALAICREHEETAKKPKTVRCGRWITKDSKTAKCSCCGWWQRTKTYYLPDDIPAFSKCYRFCTSCGVQMDGGAEQ